MIIYISYLFVCLFDDKFTFSLSVSAATLPKPIEVIHVIVKYSAVMYIECTGGPPDIYNKKYNIVEIKIQHI